MRKHLDIQKTFYISSFLLFLYIISVPLEGIFYYHNVTWIGTVIVSLMVVVYPFLILFKSKLRFNYIEILIYILIIWSLLTLIFSNDFTRTTNSIFLQVYLLFPVLFLLILKYNYLPNYKLLINSYSIALLFALAYSLFNIFILGNVFEHGRLSLSESYNPSWFAALLGLGVILSITNVSIANNTMRKLFWSLVILIFLFVLIFTQGRNAMVALFLAGMITVIVLYTKDFFRFVFYLVLKKRLAKVMAIFIGVLIITIFSVVYIVNTYPELLSIERLMRFQSGDIDSITSNRATIWTNYFKIFEFDHHAIFGHGLWSSAFIYEEYYGIVKPPHNTFISVFFELGIVGLIIYLCFFIALGIHTFKQRGILAKASQATFLYAFFLNFGNDMLTYKYFWITIFFSILLVKYNRLIETSNKQIT